LVCVICQAIRGVEVFTINITINSIARITSLVCIGDKLFKLTITSVQRRSFLTNIRRDVRPNIRLDRLSVRALHFPQGNLDPILNG
jgi:hypothetical protein